MRELLLSRGETLRPAFVDEVSAEDLINDYKHLFFGRKEITDDIPNIEIGPIDQPQRKVSVHIAWEDVEGENGSSSEDESDSELKVPVEPILYIQSEGELSAISLERVISDRGRIARSGGRPEVNANSYQFVPMAGLTNLELTKLWDKTTLTILEDQVIAALQIINPEIERISIINRGERSVQLSSVIVKLRGSNSRIPLKSLGDGMNRLLGLALAAVSTKEGFMLADEVESGLHYSVQAEMWRLLFSLSETLNIQIFATTHSYDCVKSFCQASLESPVEGVITRLYRNNENDVASTLFSEEDMKFIAEQQIEVR